MNARNNAGGVNTGFELTNQPPSTLELLRDVWRSRELVLMLSRKDFFVKFRRTSGGILWSILLPVVQATVMSIVLSRVVRFDTGITYVVFIYAGQMTFNFLGNGVTAGVGSVIDASGLTTKIYFPRLVLPLVVVGGGFYSLIPGLGVLLVLATVFDAELGLNTLWLAPAVVLLCLLTASLAAVFSVIQVYVRDLRYVVAAAQQPWQYLSPVFYPLAAVGDYRGWLELNPATGVIQMVRAAVGGADPDWGTSVIWTGVWTVSFAAIAIALFRKYNRLVVDRL